MHCPCLSSIYEKANCIAISWTGPPYSVRNHRLQGVWATSLPHKGGGVMLSALPKNKKQDNLPACSPQHPLNTKRQAGKL